MNSNRKTEVWYWVGHWFHVPASIGRVGNDKCSHTWEISKQAPQNYRKELCQAIGRTAHPVSLVTHLQNRKE